MNKKLPRIFVSLIVALLIGAGSAWYLIVRASNTHFEDDSKLFYIPADQTTEMVIRKLSTEGIIRRSRTFVMTHNWMSEPMLRPGRYRLEKGMGNRELITILGEGIQEPVQVKTNFLRDVPHLAGRLSQYLQADSATFARWLLDPMRIDSIGTNYENLSTYFIVNTYSLEWTDTPAQVFNFFLAEHDAFWNENRQSEADAIGLSHSEAYTLASIVKGEAMKQEEAPRIAGLYLNRLKIGMPLQADPTVVFAMGKENVGQVFYSDLEVDSRYNTYQHVGLPPGPIFLTEGHFIDAVLNAESHSFIYMCAKPGAIGEHSFTASYSDHLKNATEYHKWYKEYSQRTQDSTGSSSQ